MKRKDWISKAKEMGKLAFEQNRTCVPELDVDFMNIIPNLNSWERKDCLLKRAMMKAWTKSWTIASLNVVL